MHLGARQRPYALDGLVGGSRSDPLPALDPTRRFCDLNEELCRRSRLDDKVEVVCGDARGMPIDDGQFDVVWTQAVWPNIDDKPAMLLEMHRVLKDGGRVALYEIVSGPGEATSSTRCRGLMGLRRASRRPRRAARARRISRLRRPGVARRSGAGHPHRGDRRLRWPRHDDRGRGHHARARDAGLRAANGITGPQRRGTAHRTGYGRPLQGLRPQRRPPTIATTHLHGRFALAGVRRTSKPPVFPECSFARHAVAVAAAGSMLVGPRTRSSRPPPTASGLVRADTVRRSRAKTAAASGLPQTRAPPGSSSCSPVRTSSGAAGGCAGRTTRRSPEHRGPATTDSRSSPQVPSRADRIRRSEDQARRDAPGRRPLLQMTHVAAAKYADSTPRWWSHLLRRQGEVRLLAHLPHRSVDMRFPGIKPITGQFPPRAEFRQISRAYETAGCGPDHRALRRARRRAQRSEGHSVSQSRLGDHGARSAAAPPSHAQRLRGAGRSGASARYRSPTGRLLSAPLRGGCRTNGGRVRGV